MCVVSMVIDHYWEKWRDLQPIGPITPTGQPWVTPSPLPKLPTAEEIAEFRKLLERAREYDRKNNQPDCEMEEKKARIKNLADELGVEISF